MFHSGDKVRCIDACDSDRRLTLNNLYVVLRAAPESLQVKDDKGFATFFFCKRFLLAKTIQRNLPAWF